MPDASRQRIQEVLVCCDMNEEHALNMQVVALHDVPLFMSWSMCVYALGLVYRVK